MLIFTDDTINDSCIFCKYLMTWWVI